MKGYAYHCAIKYNLTIDPQRCSKNDKPSAQICCWFNWKSIKCSMYIQAILHWPINSRNVYFYLHTYKSEIGINAHDKGLNFYRHMPWSFCVQCVNMRGDGSFSRYWWNCWHHCLNFLFISLYVNGVHIAGSFWCCVTPIYHTAYTVLYLEFTECHQTMFFAQICRNICLQIYLISWNSTLIHGLLSFWLLIRS